MQSLERLFESNRRWAAAQVRHDPEFFSRLAALQAPRYLWIGCSDSRVPANTIVGVQPGEVFVHRNIANQVGHTDFNLLSVLQYAVDVLKVDHVIVVGHYDCGGVTAAFRDISVGLADNWLRPLQQLHREHREELGALPDDTARLNRLCELNVARQVAHLTETTIVRDAWKRGQDVTLHGWIYNLHDGILRDLEVDAGL
jgi:carbonic anhydrase